MHEADVASAMRFLKGQRVIEHRVAKIAAGIVRDRSGMTLAVEPLGDGADRDRRVTLKWPAPRRVFPQMAGRPPRRSKDGRRSAPSARGEGTPFRMPLRNVMQARADSVHAAPRSTSAPAPIRSGGPRSRIGIQATRDAHAGTTRRTSSAETFIGTPGKGPKPVNKTVGRGAALVSISAI